MKLHEHKHQASSYQVMDNAGLKDEDSCEIDRDYINKNKNDVGMQVEILPYESKEENSNLRILLRIDSVVQDPSLFCIKLSTNHPSFRLKKSLVLRNFSSFFSLEDALHQYQKNLPYLPSRHQLWTAGQETKIECLINWLASVISLKNILSCKSIHLFLQTQLSIERINENAAGKRKDEVVESIIEKQEDVKFAVKMLKELPPPVSNRPVHDENRRKSFGDHLALLRSGFLPRLSTLREL